jgi:signal transduction histidine kinase
VGPRRRDWVRHLSPLMLPEVDETSVGEGYSYSFEQSDLVLFWHRLRAIFLVVVAVCALVLALGWGSLHFGDWSLNAPLLVAGLAVSLFVDACLRIRRRSNRPLLPIFLDATAVTVGLVLLRVPSEALAAPFLYVALSAAIVLPLRRAVWMWCYAGLLAALVVIDPLPTQWLGQSPTVTQLHAAVWMATGVFSLLCLAETLVLTGAVRRFARARHARLIHESRRKDDFLAGVSHELRTPLTGVLGFASELRDGIAAFSSAEIVEFADHIAQGCVIANNLVEDLLVAARSDSDHLDLVLGPTDLRLLALAGIADPGTSSSTKGRLIAVEGQSVVAWADPNRVSQIIRNLVANADRYGECRTIIVTGITAGPRRAFLRVVDDGPGVPNFLIDRLFQRYQHGIREHGRTDSVGLGLYLSRNLARLMGGDLTYRRQDGTTIFELTLPLFEEAANQGA